MSYGIKKSGLSTLPWALYETGRTEYPPEKFIRKCRTKKEAEHLKRYYENPSIKTARALYHFEFENTKKRDPENLVVSMRYLLILMGWNKPGVVVDDYETMEPINLTVPED